MDSQPALIQRIAGSACLFALLLSGCFGPAVAKPKTPQATITGVVMIDGKPVPANSDVVFYNKDEDTTLAAKADSQGKFTLKASDPRTGIPAGSYHVAVIPPVPPAANPHLKPGTKEYEDRMKGIIPNVPDVKPGTDIIPAKYQDKNSTDIVVQAKPGENEFLIPLAK